MKKRIPIIIIVVLVLISVGVIYYINNDSRIIKKINEEFDRNYKNISFEYIGKERDVSANQKIYYFKWIENEKITIKVTTGWSTNSPVPFLPFHIRRYITDNFSDEVKEYIVNEKYRGELDITDMGVDEATQRIYDLKKDIAEQLAHYYKSKYAYTSEITLKIIYKNHSEDVSFYSSNKGTIHDLLVKVMLNEYGLFSK